MLVLVPLVLETFLLLLVGWMSQQAELALVEQRSSLEQTIHANRLIAAGTVGYGYYCRYLISRDDKSREKGEHFVQIALSEFKVLLALAGNDEEKKRAAPLCTRRRLHNPPRAACRKMKRRRPFPRRTFRNPHGVRPRVSRALNALNQPSKAVVQEAPLFFPQVHPKVFHRFW